MKTKIFNKIAFSILSLVLFMNLLSAGFTISPTSLTFNPSTTSQTFTITNTNSSELISVNFDSTLTINGNIFDVTGTKTDINSTSTITITPQTTIDFSALDLGDSFTSNLLVSDASNASDNATVTIEIDDNKYCSAGDAGNDLDLKIDIQNTAGYGEKDDEWYPLDKIEFEVEVENDGNDDIDDIVIEWGLYNPSTGKFVIDDEEDDFNLKDGKKKTITIEFIVDPDDLEENEENYVFYVKAYSNDLDEENECISISENIEVILENDFVVLEDIELTDASCGSETTITADVWNIGEDDQDDVTVGIFNSELGLNQIVEIGDIDALDNEKLELVINIPEDAESKAYTLNFEVYDEDNELFQNKEDVESTFNRVLSVSGSCSIEPTALVSAVLESGGKAGSQLVIKSTITNTGDKLVTYVLNAAGYAEWASTASLDQDTIALNAGDSKDVSFTFDVKKSAEGDKSFDIEILSGNELIVKQPVSVTIEKSGFSLGFIDDANWYLWGIGALNIILVVIIILVAMRVMKK